jgi:NAD-dependent protein deacetylase/lipoamidase
MIDAIEHAAELFAAARRVVVVTGAGMSKESGIPTFRDAQTGLWSRYDPQELATRRGFANNPALVWTWYAERRAIIERAQPHDGYRALAQMEPHFDSLVILTQNIDGLHSAAGSCDVVELHGNIRRTKCFDANHPTRGPHSPDDIPPRCECGSLLRPDVVWFGEMLDPAHLDRAAKAIDACDVMLVVGTSALVYPAAGFPEDAGRAGKPVIEINPEETPLTASVDVSVRMGARDALMELGRRLTEARHRQER